MGVCVTDEGSYHDDQNNIDLTQLMQIQSFESIFAEMKSDNEKVHNEDPILLQKCNKLKAYEISIKDTI